MRCCMHAWWCLCLPPPSAGPHALVLVRVAVPARPRQRRGARLLRPATSTTGQQPPHRSVRPPPRREGGQRPLLRSLTGAGWSVAVGLAWSQQAGGWATSRASWSWEASHPTTTHSTTTSPPPAPPPPPCRTRRPCCPPQPSAHLTSVRRQHRGQAGRPASHREGGKGYAGSSLVSVCVCLPVYLVVVAVYSGWCVVLPLLGGRGGAHGRVGGRATAAAAAIIIGTVCSASPPPVVAATGAAAVPSRLGLSHARQQQPGPSSPSGLLRGALHAPAHGPSPHLHSQHPAHRTTAAGDGSALLHVANSATLMRMAVVD